VNRNVLSSQWNCDSVLHTVMSGGKLFHNQAPAATKAHHQQLHMFIGCVSDKLLDSHVTCQKKFSLSVKLLKDGVLTKLGPTKLGTTKPGRQYRLRFRK